MGARTVVEALAVERPARGFSVRSARELAATLDPFLTADRFQMSERTFPPHPHAGFSAITYILPESPNAFANRDSRGDASPIRPGDLHVSEAASGMLHEETPHEDGVPAEGLQIFVKLPRASELGPPRALHVDAAAAPIVENGAVRVLAGAYGGGTAPITPAYPFTLLDVTVRPGERLVLRVPDDEAAWLLVVHGPGGLVDGRRVGPTGAALLAAGPVVLASPEGAPSPLRVVVGSGRPIGEPVVFAGPFAMSDQDRAQEAHTRYRAGLMGALSPRR